MNKSILLTGLISLMTLSATALTPGTDILDVQTLAAGGLELTPDISYAAVTYVSPTTGTPYLVSNYANHDGQLYFGMGLGMRNTETCGYLKEIRVNDLTGTFTVYAGNEPISTSPFSQAGVVSLPVDRETGIVAVDAPYRYIGVWTFETTVSDIQVEWSEEAPQAVAAKPFIVLNSELGCPSGSTVTIDSDTKTASIEVKVTRGSETLLEETMSNPCTVTLTGEVGDKITVEARAVAEGYIASDWMKRTYPITTPMLSQPEVSLSSYSSVVTLGQTVTLTNPNEEGSLMTYSVCGGDEVSTTESTVSMTVDGSVGDAWSLTAWCTAEGWDDSEQTVWEGTIATNVCPAPVFSPAPGEYAEGTSIRISATYPAASVTYRVNGGEWQTSTSLWNLSVTLTEDMTIEAYSSAAAPYVDSETVTGEFRLERIGTEMDVITCASFGQVSGSQFDTYASAETSNGAEYALSGRSMDTGMFVNGTGYVRTIRSDKAISRIKVDARFLNALVLYVGTDEIVSRDPSLASYVIEEPQFGQWIEIPVAMDAKYFYLTAQGMDLANVIDRVVVDYSDYTGVGTVAADDADTVWYDLTGRRVAEPAQGLYIRVSGGKAAKIFVK